tara:strand:- start:374 stop:1666 length:1293 start_codon:yes stop_codon:yes gene_type:complete
MDKLVFWECNEINFEYVKRYIASGRLSNWRDFIEKHGLFTTQSENKYENLEPWIQWPTVRTGLDFSDHHLFRLGDSLHKDIKQHWELIEKKGYKVAAVSPINGLNKTTSSPFWIPDPWVDTKASGSNSIKRFASAIKQAVNDNAQGKLELKTIFSLAEMLIFSSQSSSWSSYIYNGLGALRRRRWSKAIILDRLLTDTFMHMWKKHQPDFGTLFLNAGAHIQHHYLYSSSAYDGNVKNPKWYIKSDRDPLLEVLELYDKVLCELNKLPNTRLMISIGMRQIPYKEPIFYWRLKNHNAFLKKINIKYKSVKPRMTRDFLIEFEKKTEKEHAMCLLKSMTSQDGQRIFNEIEDKGLGLFVSLTYHHDISRDFKVIYGENKYLNFKDDVVFVAIKNGHHDSKGYYLDSYRQPGELQDNIPLRNLFSYTMDHFN